MNSFLLKFLMPLLLVFVAADFSFVHAAASRTVHSGVQHCTQPQKAKGHLLKTLKTRFLGKAASRTVEKKKTDGLAIAVFVGGLASFILVFPVKFFLGFAILGLATLVMAIFALCKLRRRSDLGGRWLVILGILLVVVPAAIFGLAIAALSKL